MVLVLALPVTGRAQEAGLRLNGIATAQPDARAGIGFLASAVLPGAGQYYLGSQRWVPYLVLETWAVASYVDRHRTAVRLEQRYRDLAWAVARRVGTGERRDSAFTYYEAIAFYDRSGAFDSNPAQTGIQPEPDTLTFNGEQWRRARALFSPGGVDPEPGSPEYQQAIEFYLRNAIPADYAWSWIDSGPQKQVFNRLIDDSDQAFRGASRLLGLILANHVVSAIDALITARLQAAAGIERQLRIGSTITPVGGEVRWSATLRIPTGK